MEFAVKGNSSFPIFVSGLSSLGMAEPNSQGDDVGEIIVLNYGANAARLSRLLKTKLEELMQGLPEDV